MNSYYDDKQRDFERAQREYENKEPDYFKDNDNEDEDNYDYSNCITPECPYCPSCEYGYIDYSNCETYDDIYYFKTPWICTYKGYPNEAK